MKRTIYAAFAAATLLSLQPVILGSAHTGARVSQIALITKRSPALITGTSQHVATDGVVSNSGKKRSGTRSIAMKASSSKKSQRLVIRRRSSGKGNVKIAKRAFTVAKQMNTVGWCYKGVCIALRPLGIHLSGAAAYEAKDQLLKDGRFKAFKLGGVRDLKPGDILVHGKSNRKPYGHIAVYLGNASEASDHVQKVVLNGPYNGTTVFRYDGSSEGSGGS